MNSLSNSPVLPSPDEYSGGGAWQADALQAVNLSLRITNTQPIARVVPPSYANVDLIDKMGNGSYPEVANRAGGVAAIDDIMNLHDSEDEDSEQEEEPGDKDNDQDEDKDCDQEEVDQEEADQEEADQEEANPEESDQEEVDQESRSRSNERAYVLSASGRSFPPRDWRPDQSLPRYGDLDQATQCHAPRIQGSCNQAQAQPRNPLPPLQTPSGRGADGSDDTSPRETGQRLLPAQGAHSERLEWKQSTSPAPGLPSPFMDLDARALTAAPRPDPAGIEIKKERAPDKQFAVHAQGAQGGERLQSSTPNGSFLAASVGLRGNDQAAESDRGPSPHLAAPVDVPLHSTNLEDHLKHQTRLLDPGSVMALHTPSSSAAHSPPCRDETPASNFSTASVSASRCSFSPVSRASYSPRGFSQQNPPGQFQSMSQSLPPMQPPKASSHLDTEANPTSMAAGKAIVGVDNSQQQQNLPSIREVLESSIMTPHHSTPVFPSKHAYGGFPPPSGVGEDNYPPISRRATTDYSGGLRDPVPQTRDAPQTLRRVATAPKYLSIAPQRDNDNDSGVHRSQPAIAAAISQPHAQSQPGQHPPAPTGSFVCPEPNCKAPPFLTQYQLSSHANVHSSERPHFCSVPECPHSKPGNGFKRKNEMIRHGLVHRPPGYSCPFCPGRKHKYPRRDNLRRHVRGAHKDKSKDDPQLLHVLTQRPEGPNGRRR